MACVARLVSFLAVRFGSTVRCERIVGSAGLSSKCEIALPGERSCPSPRSGKTEKFDSTRPSRSSRFAPERQRRTRKSLAQNADSQSVATWQQVPIDAAGNVEDTKGNSGELGTLTVSNLRLTWVCRKQAHGPAQMPKGNRISLALSPVK